MTDIHEQLSNVEIKLAFQDDLVETLNQIVIGPQQQLDLLRQQVQLLYQQFKSLQPSDIAYLAQEVPPPHY